MITPLLVHYCSIIISIVLPTLGVALGQALTSHSALQAMDEQAAAASSLQTHFTLCLVIIETAAILSTFISILLLYSSAHYGYASAGIALAVAIPSFFVGLFSAYPALESCKALARQPFLKSTIMNLVFIILTILQTPIIFGFLVALLIRGTIEPSLSSEELFKLAASGLTMALGSIGPIIGLSLFGAAACTALGNNPEASQKITTFTLISQALIETPIFFTLVVSLALLITSHTSSNSPLAYLAAAFAMGMSTFGVGISSGRTAAAACTEIGKNMERYPLLLRVSPISQALIDTGAIYGLIVAFVIIFL